MPFDPVALALAKKKLLQTQKKYDSDLDLIVDLASIPTIPRTKLEYPTEDVPLIYLMAIGKFKWFGAITGRNAVVTVDSFTDKAVETPSVSDYLGLHVFGRIVDANNCYYGRIIPANVTADDEIRVVSAGTGTVLASSAVDLSGSYLVKFSCSGSTLSWFRDDMTTPVISATDTTFTSGLFGSMLGAPDYDDENYPAFGYLRPPASPLPPAQRIIEAEITGSGTPEDPIRPNFKQLLDKHPEFGDIDILAVTWGAFDYKGEPTMLCVVTGDNPYRSGAILEQESYAKSKNLKVFRPPRDLTEARELHKQIKAGRPDLIAGVHNLAYHTIGDENLEPLAVADFYDGFVQGIYDMKDLEKVPRWELERTIRMWLDRLERSNVTAEEKDKARRKLRGVLKA